MFRNKEILKKIEYITSRLISLENLMDCYASNIKDNLKKGFKEYEDELRQEAQKKLDLYNKLQKEKERRR